MEKWKEIHFVLLIFIFLLEHNPTETRTYRKRTEIESELYKNVLPYIKLVEHDAEKARSEIKKTKVKHNKRHSKAKLLKEVDQKVIPWLAELTKATLSKEKTNRGFSYQLKHFPHNIQGPSALNLNQVDQIGQDHGSDLNKLFTENNKETTNKTHNVGYLKHLKGDDHLDHVENRNVINKQEVVGQMKELKPSLDQQHLLGDDTLMSESGERPTAIANLFEGSKSTGEADEEEKDRDIASEVAKITNEIAEFQEQIKHMTNGLEVTSQDQKEIQNHLDDESDDIINKETVGSTDNIKINDAPHLEDNPSKKKLNNDTLDTGSDLDITDMANNNPVVITKSLFEPKASLFNEKQSATVKKPSKKKFKINKAGSESVKIKKKTSGSVKIIFAGNVGFDGIVQYKVETGICTYNESFKKIKADLEKADHVVVSLDSPFKLQNKTDEDDSSYDDPEYTFSYAGIDTVVLANDHILDYGPDAAKYTAKKLRHTNTLYSGFTFSLNPKTKQEPVIYATNGVTVGLLSYCMNKEGCSVVRNKTKAGPAIFNEKIVKEEVLALRESGIDVVALYLHWGDEDDLIPSFQVKDIIRNISSVKIDVIVGNHPNIDGHYYFRGTLVVLSLGTFLTPLHIQLYKTYPVASKHSKLIEKLWDKQSERWEMPSVNSKLLQIEVNRDGLIPFKARYLPIQMNLNSNHCLQTERVKNEWWIPICTRRDKQCMGSNKCNELECDPSLSMRRK